MPPLDELAAAARCSPPASPKMKISRTRSSGHAARAPLAVARAPGLDHRVDRLAPAEPAEERLVDRHGRVGGEHPRGDREASSSALRDAEEAADDLGRAPPAAASPSRTRATTCSAAESGRKFTNVPSPSSPPSRSILPRSAASTIGTGCGRRRLELEAARRRARRRAPARSISTVSRIRVSGFSNGISFQRSTITFDDEPRPSTKRPPRRVGERRGVLREHRAARACTGSRRRCRGASARSTRRRARAA